MKLIILDRDGVINIDSDAFIKTPEEWIALDGSLEAIASLKSAGWTVAVATNQSGIARGLLDHEALQAIHARMQDELASLNARVDWIGWCPHGPDDGCHCRKPRPGLYHQIAASFHCSLVDVPIVGDSLRDLLAAHEVGGQPILVQTGKGKTTMQTARLPAGTHVYRDLLACVKALLNKGRD